MELLSFESTKLEIQLIFDDPIMVSRGSSLDKISVKLERDYFLLALNQNGESLEEDDISPYESHVEI